jgi:hypothetical protein
MPWPRPKVGLHYSAVGERDFTGKRTSDTITGKVIARVREII